MEEFTVEDKKTLIKKADPFWWHSIDLGDGIITPGRHSLAQQYERCKFIPKDLKGKFVLDVGTWDGFYAFECEKRGAKVMAIDMLDRLAPDEGFAIAKKILGSNVEFHKMDFFELPDKIKEKFDMILFFEVLYHLKHPFKALEILADKTKELLMLGSIYIKTKAKEPMMRFKGQNDGLGHPSNWWAPNMQCLIDMLKLAGFKKTEICQEKCGRVIIKAYK